MQENTRRLYLRSTVKLMGVVTLLALAYPFIASTLSTPDTPSEQQAMEVELGGIATGQAKEVLWQGRRVMILHRDETQLKALKTPPPLTDPASQHSHQPEAARNSHRSLNPAYLVVIGYGSSGCPVDWVTDTNPVPWEPWAGGFRDRCNQGWFDPAGRAVSASGADNNLPVPRYRLLGPQRIALDGL